MKMADVEDRGWSKEVLFGGRRCENLFAMNINSCLLGSIEECIAGIFWSNGDLKSLERDPKGHVSSVRTNG